jgi:hypothetical protein
MSAITQARCQASERRVWSTIQETMDHRGATEGVDAEPSSTVTAASLDQKTAVGR